MSQTIQIPEELQNWINRKLEKNGEGGRPNLIRKFQKRKMDVTNEVLAIISKSWLKNQSIGKIARHYKVSYHTIMRLLQELEPLKPILTEFLKELPKKRTFFNRELEISDYPTVMAYIRRAKRDELKHYRKMLKYAMECWKYLDKTDPKEWTSYDVAEFLKTKPESTQFLYLVAIRQVAPQIGEMGSDELGTGRYKEKMKRRKKDVFANEFNMILEALRHYNMDYHETILKLHITLGCREGSKSKTDSGICGITWNRFKYNFTKCDVFESKVKSGIWWRDCPLDLLFKDLPKRLKKLWEERGKPINAKVLGERKTYENLLKIYKEIRKAISQYWKDKLDPNLFKDLATLKPHDADKIHVNLLWEADVPLEIVGGTYLGRGEGIGLVGRGWLDLNTIKQHYLSLTQRSKRFQKIVSKVKNYSKQFNGEN